VEKLAAAHSTVALADDNQKIEDIYAKYVRPTDLLAG